MVSVILSEAKEPERGFGSFASLRMTHTHTHTHTHDPMTMTHTHDTTTP